MVLCCAVRSLLYILIVSQKLSVAELKERVDRIKQDLLDTETMRREFDALKRLIDV